MPRDVHKREVENFGCTNFYGRWFGINIGFQIGIAKLNEVGERSWVGIPVAAAIVFQQGNFYTLILRRGREQENAENDYKVKFLCL